MSQMVGEQSIGFQQPVHILSGASVVGKKEGEGPLGSCFDKINHDPPRGGQLGDSGEYHAGGGVTPCH